MTSDNAASTAAEVVSRDHIEPEIGRAYLRRLASRGMVTIAGDDVAFEERGLMQAFLDLEGGN